MVDLETLLWKASSNPLVLRGSPKSARLKIKGKRNKRENYLTKIAEIIFKTKWKHAPTYGEVTEELFPEEIKKNPREEKCKVNTNLDRLEKQKLITSIKIEGEKHYLPISYLFKDENGNEILDLTKYQIRGENKKDYDPTKEKIKQMIEKVMKTEIKQMGEQKLRYSSFDFFKDCSLFLGELKKELNSYFNILRGYLENLSDMPSDAGIRNLENSKKDFEKSEDIISAIKSLILALKNEQELITLFSISQGNIKKINKLLTETIMNYNHFLSFSFIDKDFRSLIEIQMKYWKANKYHLLGVATPSNIISIEVIKKLEEASKLFEEVKVHHKDPQIRKSAKILELDSHRLLLLRKVELAREKEDLDEELKCWEKVENIESKLYEFYKKEEPVTANMIFERREFVKVNINEIKGRYEIAEKILKEKEIIEKYGMEDWFQIRIQRIVGKKNLYLGLEEKNLLQMSEYFKRSYENFKKCYKKDNKDIDIKYLMLVANRLLYDCKALLSKGAESLKYREKELEILKEISKIVADDEKDTWMILINCRKFSLLFSQYLQSKDDKNLKNALKYLKKGKIVAKKIKNEKCYNCFDNFIKNYLKIIKTAKQKRIKFISSISDGNDLVKGKR